MGQELGKIDKTKTSSMLRQAVSRINIHRGKKLNGIAKKKDDICKHLESGNEVNAKIWAETLINEEQMIPVYDIVAIMCDQVNGRLTTIQKFGPPKDMDQTFHSLIHVGAKSEIEELAAVRSSLGKMLGKEFVKTSDTDYSSLNKVIAENIDIKIPEPGEVVKRLIELARERNIPYTPSHESAVSLNDYCLRKGIQNPLTGKIGGEPAVVVQIPDYNPSGMPAPIIVPPPAHQQQQPQMYPSPQFMPGPGYPGMPQMSQRPPPPMYNYTPQGDQHFQPPFGGPVYGMGQHPPASQAYPEMPTTVHQPQNINPFLPPASSGAPNYAIPPRMPEDDTTSVNTVDDFEARLAALKKL